MGGRKGLGHPLDAGGTVPAYQVAHLARLRVVYDLLFRAASETLQTFERDPKHLGGTLGPTVILHTWSQTLSLHPHLYCVVTGGALASDGSRWIPTRAPGFRLGNGAGRALMAPRARALPARTRAGRG
jgi:hypothetical protein